MKPMRDFLFSTILLLDSANFTPSEYGFLANEIIIHGEMDIS